MRERDNKYYDIFWDKQAKRYGVTRYEKYIIHEILKRKPKRVFEVGIGNGWPIGVALCKKDIIVHGCDISEKLVSAARENLGGYNDKDRIFVGDVKQYQNSEKFDIVYCARTSWYIDDFESTICKMISMTENGYVLFDIMQKESLYYVKQSFLKIKWKILKFLGINLEEHINLFFYSKHKIERLLRDNNILFYSYSEKEITRIKDCWNTPKRIYICRIK